MNIIFTLPLGVVNTTCREANLLVGWTDVMGNLLALEDAPKVIEVLDHLEVHPRYYQEVTLHFAIAFSLSRLFSRESPLKEDAIRKVVDRLPSEESVRKWRESKSQPEGWFLEKVFNPAFHTNFFESGEHQIVGEGNRWIRKKPGSDQLPSRDIDDWTTPGPPQKVNPSRKAFRIFAPKKDE